MGLRAQRVTSPDDLETAIGDALAHPGPVLLDVITNPNEIALPPKAEVRDAWGFAIAKAKEALISRD